MTRRHLTFPCEGSTLVATLDHAEGECGLLIVSGGNEVRAGSWSGQAQLAAHLAQNGHPVFRYDRRGVGDSDGANGGYRSGGPDLAAALAAFRQEMPGLRRIVAFGNCDGASTLALFASALPLNGLVLANPWTLEHDAETTMPAKAIRTRYIKKAINPSEWIRFLTGDVNLRKLMAGLRQASARASTPTGLAAEMQAALASYQGEVVFLLAENDRTAQLFEAAWPKDDSRVRRCASRSHSFSDELAQEWLHRELLAALAG